MKIRKNKLEINNDLCNCCIDLENAEFKIWIKGQPPYSYEDFESVLTDIEDEITRNE